MCLAVHQKIAHFAFGLDGAIFVDIQLFSRRAGGLNQRRVNLRVAHIHVGLPLVGGAQLAGVLGFGVIDRGQIAVTTLVIHREGRAFVVSGCVGAAERRSDHRGVCRKVQAQVDQRGLRRLTRGLLRNGQHIQVAQVGLARRVNRRGHQTLACRVHHVVLIVHHERAVAGVDVLQAVGRLQREETVTGDSQVQRVGRKRHVALTKLLGHLFQCNALTNGG